MCVSEKLPIAIAMGDIVNRIYGRIWKRKKYRVKTERKKLTQATFSKHQPNICKNIP